MKSKDLSTAAREVKRAPTKQEQLAKLIIELGIDAAQAIFDRVRERSIKIS